MTDFFRDPAHFSILASDVIPVLFEKLKKNQEELRIWVSPCSTGEEAYSVAMLFKQYSEEQHLPFSVKIFASDVCHDFIQIAKKGRYSYKSVTNVPKDLLNKYFIKSTETYEIIPEIKNKIIFTTHNLLRDPPFIKMDLICCRNLLIYINPKEQKRITDLLRFSLNIGGFLFLGPSEGLTSMLPDLVATNQIAKIFQKTKQSGSPFTSRPKFVELSNKNIQTEPVQISTPGSLPLYVYNNILQEVVVSGFIIDTSLTVLHSIGKAHELLGLPEGAPSLILPKIIIDDLKGALIAALHKVKNQLIPVLYENITIYQQGNKPQIMKMAIHPIFDKNNKISYYWIRIDPVKTSIESQSKMLISDAQKDPHHDEIIVALQGELAEARTLLQSSLASMETINAEIQTTNEELMASNEELQSSNEELQAVNEELYTVNLERAQKIEEINQAKADIDNLIRGADICTIILNNKLEIRIFTPAIEKIFNLLNHDIGRPLKNFKHNLKFDLFMVKAEEVLKNNTPYESEVQNNQNHWYFLKMIPYYAIGNQMVAGVVITLTDINETKRLQQQKLELEKNLKLALKTGLIGVWRLDLKKDSFTCDETIKEIFGLNAFSTMTQFKHFIAAIHLDDRKRIENAFALTREKEEIFEQNFRIIRPDGNVRYLSCSANIQKDLSSDLACITGICWDMTERYWLGEKIIDAESLKLSLDSITDGWWDWDLVHQKTFLSPRLKKTLGYEDHELSNRIESYEQLILP